MSAAGGKDTPAPAIMSLERTVRDYATMIFGNKSTFAIECRVEDRPYPALFGHFIFWANEELIGDPADSVMIRACANWLGDFLKYTGKRHEPVFDSLSAEELFTLVYETIVFIVPEGKTLHECFHEGVGGNYVPPPFEDCRERFHLDMVGMSSFMDTVSVILIERSDGKQRLIWRNVVERKVREVLLERLQFDRTAQEFLKWMKDEWNVIPTSFP